MSGAGLMEPGHRFRCLFFKIRPGYKVKYHGAEAATYIVIDLISGSNAWKDARDVLQS